MADQPPFFNQETDYSCVPACLRMVLAAFGLHRSEDELRELCDCTFLGTDDLLLIEAARSLGFQAEKHSMNLFDLKDKVSGGVFPIAFIRTLLVAEGKREIHAVVVFRFSEQGVHMHDPWRGRGLIVQEEEFLQEWRATHCNTVLIE